MPEHYYTARPQSAHEERHFRTVFSGRPLEFETDAGVFSKQHIDPGSELLCRSLPQTLCGDVAFAEAEPIVRAVTPVPGGVGALTTAVLAAHTAKAAARRLPFPQKTDGLFGERDSLCSAPRPAACGGTATLAARREYFAAYTPPRNMIELYSWPPSRELCETKKGSPRTLSAGILSYCLKRL